MNTNDKELNQFKLSFLSGYDQIIFDKLDEDKNKIFDLLCFDMLIEDKNEISGFSNKIEILSMNKIIIEEKIVKFNEIIADLIVNSLNKFKYVDDRLNNTEEKIYDYKKNIFNF